LQLAYSEAFGAIPINVHQQLSVVCLIICSCHHTLLCGVILVQLLSRLHVLCVRLNAWWL